MSGWTPGPWAWHSRKHDDGRNDGSVLADVESGRARCICKAPQHEKGNQWEANANLIAAAPDLYEALADLVYAHEGQPGWGAARGALAKARGEGAES